MAEKVADIRADLIKLGLTEQQVNDIKGRPALLEKRLELMPVQDEEQDEQDEDYQIEGQEPEEYPTTYDSTDIDDGMDDGTDDGYAVTYEEDPFSDAIDQVQQNKVNFENNIPDRGTPDWDAYIMSQFTSDELIDFGKIKTPCLRGVSRVVNKMFDIEKSGPSRVENWFANNNPAATVTYEVVGVDKVTSKRYTFSAVADAWSGNMGDNKDFNTHPSAVAESRAESRALKKLLDLRSVPAYEEIAKSNNGYGPSVFDEQEEKTSNITEIQQATIEAKCKQFGVDVYKFINKLHFVDPEKHPEPKFSMIDELTNKQAAKLLKELGDYQKSDETAKPIPEQIFED